MSKQSIRRLEKLENRRNRRITNTKVSLIITMLSVIILGTGGFLAYDKYFGNMNGTLTSLVGFIGPTGQLVDPRNEVGVNSIEDIGFWSEGEKLSIKYGKFRIDFKKSPTEEEQALLIRLGIKVKQNSRGNYIITYRGERVDRYEILK